MLLTVSDTLRGTGSREHANKLAEFSSVARWTNTVPVPLVWR